MIGKFAAPSMNGRFVIRKPTFALTIMNDRNGSTRAVRDRLFSANIGRSSGPIAMAA